MTFTYDIAIYIFQQKVNRKLPPGTRKGNNRHINENNTDRYHGGYGSRHGGHMGNRRKFRLD